jgi:hypothetical protein
MELAVQGNSGNSYCTEFASSLAGGWTNIGDVIATADLFSVTCPIDEGVGFLRTYHYRP